MVTSVLNRGVTGKLQLLFAIPTDDPKKWHLKKGFLTYDNGATVGIDVEGGDIPHSKGKHGLTVTYHVPTSVSLEKERRIGDIARYTCIDGRMMEVEDIAFGVEVTLPQETVAPAGKTQATIDQP